MYETIYREIDSHSQIYFPLIPLNCKFLFASNWATLIPGNPTELKEKTVNVGAIIFS